MSMMQKFIDDNLDKWEIPQDYCLSKITKEKFNMLVEDISFTQAYEHEELKDLMHPLTRVYEIENISHCCGDSYEETGNFLYCFKYKNNYYLYSNQW